MTTPPSFVTAVVAGVARHALTAGAGAMAAAGMITQDQTGQAVSVGLSIVLWGFGVWWSAIQKKNSLPQSPAAQEPPF